MDFRKAAVAIPELHVLPIHWAAATLVTETAPKWLPGETISAAHLHEDIEAEAEAILDKPEGDSRHPLDHAAARIWRAVPSDRQHAVTEYLLTHMLEIMEEAG